MDNPSDVVVVAFFIFLSIAMICMAIIGHN